MMSKIKILKKMKKCIIGIDEAGRGPLAGPVVVAGIKIDARIEKQEARFLTGIKDSKKLSAKKREEWFSVLTKHPAIAWACVAISPKIIDKINIAKATNLGTRRVYKRLIQIKSGRMQSAPGEFLVLLDGSLYLPRTVAQHTIIKGDEKVPVIAAASIIAKVTRDRIMVRLHKKYPQYRFDVHKGYCTRQHRELVHRYGYSDVHRKSFKATD